MDTAYNDIVNVIENGEGDEIEQAMAMQRQINSGTIWLMQGSMGRAAMDALESGMCMLGKMWAHDAYGNTIPSRDDVKAGTKGSYKLVEMINGVEYAQALASL